MKSETPLWIWLTMAQLLLYVVGFSAVQPLSAFAQGAAPKVGNKPLVQIKPQAPMGCKLVGTVKGTKLWAGECEAATELRGTAETTPGFPAAPTTAASPPGQKQ
jgi:hypothetical protein